LTPVDVNMSDIDDVIEVFVITGKDWAFRVRVIELLGLIIV
jgi:hypothetical protein